MMEKNSEVFSGSLICTMMVYMLTFFFIHSALNRIELKPHNSKIRKKKKKCSAAKGFQHFWQGIMESGIVVQTPVARENYEFF